MNFRQRNIFESFDIRKITLEDIQDYLMLLNEPLVHENSTGLPHPITIDFVIQRISSREEREVSHQDIFQRGAYLNGRLIGVGSIFVIEKNIWEVSYFIGRNYQNNGFATTLVESLIRLTQNLGEKPKVIARHKWNNAPSRRVLEKLGFEPHRGNLKDTTRTNKDPKVLVMSLKEIDCLA